MFHHYFFPTAAGSKCFGEEHKLGNSRLIIPLLLVCSLSEPRDTQSCPLWWKQKIFGKDKRLLFLQDANDWLYPTKPCSRCLEVNYGNVETEILCWSGSEFASWQNDAYTPTIAVQTSVSSEQLSSAISQGSFGTCTITLTNIFVHQERNPTHLSMKSEYIKLAFCLWNYW